MLGVNGKEMDIKIGHSGQFMGQKIQRFDSIWNVKKTYEAVAFLDELKDLE